MGTDSEFWNGVYAAKAETAVSWFQPVPKRSLELIAEHAPERETPIIDIGGGASRLVDELMAGGYTDLAVLDIAASGLDRSRTRLGANAARVDWIVADITQWRPQRRWGVWHDRAVLHFLTSTEAQDAYLAALSEGTASGAAVIIATFALDGPERCSGLPVQRYSAQTLATRLGPDFVLQADADEVHRTPWDSSQSFTYAVFRRR
ncbi:MAG: class I SAM-dependent methyltransferase [Bauldia sp.]|nr:class I SAM-dependent methyltransferase [Bauldia sp.]MCW5717202.1 class I SAM-dependent methyltransferase [Bauldia sp.]